MTDLDNKYAGKKIYTTFHMPMQLLCIRVMVDHVFRNTFHEFFSKEQHEKISSKLINDVITHMLDPNLYFSRFSFLESGMHAINLK